VLILTAFSQRNLIEEARDAGALAYLIKPFTQAELVPAIEVALGRFKEMQEIRSANATLEEQLATRRLLDRAKGILMDDYGMKEHEAFRFIQTTAMRERRSMKDVAQDVIDGKVRPPEAPNS
jgi:two-component system, response regulator PdtaR